MKLRYALFIICLSSLLFFAACSTKDTGEIEGEDKILAVTSFTILTDIVEQIGGDVVEVYNLVPIGTDPHEYEPLPEDIKRATDADVLFYNGLQLEGGKEGWFFKLADAVGKKEEEIFELSKGVEPQYVDDEKEMNPHGFLDPTVGIQMVENALEALISIRPHYKEQFVENAHAYIEELQALDELYKEKIASIPEENRILITSERAYQYLAHTYGLEEGYIWAVDTEENGSPEQIKSLIQFIKERDVPVLFVETNVDQRPMETVSKETGIPIFAEIYSDEIGSPGDEGDTYVKLLSYNIETITEGLLSKTD